MKKIENIIIIISIFFTFFYIICFSQQKIINKFPKIDKIIIVITKDWDSYKGQLYCYEYKKNKWYEKYRWDIVTGRKGLGWGKGIINNKEGIQKREGDGKSPAGLFKIRKIIYGYNKKFKIKNPRWKYVAVNKNWIGVDDPKSKYYNKIINIKNIKDKDWNSFEYLKRDDDLYKYILIVEHNTKNIIPYRGSCIFIHKWRNQNTGTAGCIAMSEKNLLKLIQWITQSNEPYILQLPYKIYKKWQKKYNLPYIK